MSAEGDEPAFDPTHSMELVWRGQKGDTGAVNELFERYRPRMKRVVIVKLGWLRTRIDPEDVLQETLIVASSRLHELEVRTPSSIYQWLAKIVDNKIKDFLDHTGAQKRDPARERRIRSDEDSVDSTDSGVVVASGGPTASQEFSCREMEAEYDRCLATLEPPEYKEVILMHELYESDWETIRDKLGRPSIAAVKDLYKRAKARLQERLSRLKD